MSAIKIAFTSRSGTLFLLHAPEYQRGFFIIFWGVAWVLPPPRPNKGEQTPITPDLVLPILHMHRDKQDVSLGLPLRDKPPAPARGLHNKGWAITLRMNHTSPLLAGERYRAFGKHGGRLSRRWRRATPAVTRLPPGATRKGLPPRTRTHTALSFTHLGLPLSRTASCQCGALSPLPDGPARYPPITTCTLRTWHAESCLTDRDRWGKGGIKRWPLSRWLAESPGNKRGSLNTTWTRQHLCF